MTCDAERNIPTCKHVQMFPKSTLDLAALVFSVATVCSATVYADDAHTSSRVTITATRTERPTLDIPAAIDRVDAEDIRFARPQVNLSEALGRVPGISVQNRENYAQDLQVTSRGFGSRATFGIRGLRLVADGIPASMPDGQGQAANFDLGTAERIEVLRGPFSVLHGNASGGVINVVTASGASDPGFGADVAAGSYGMRRLALRAGGAQERFDWLTGVSHFRTNGYRDHSQARRELLNAKLTLAPAEATRVGLLLNAYDSPDTQDPLGLTRTQMQNNPRQVDPVALTFDTRKSVRQNQAGATITHQFSRQDALDAAVYTGQRRVVQYQAIPLNIQSLATHSGGVVDLDRAYGGVSLRYTHRTSVAGRPITLTAGGEIERMAERRRGYQNLNGTAGALKRDEDDVVGATGLYAQAEWRFAEQWIALAGLRSTRVAFRSTDYYIAAGNPDDSGTRDYRAATPVAGLTWKLSPTTSLYANMGRGFETPTFAELAYSRTGSTGLNLALNPSRSLHAEAGVKSIQGAARIDAAVFEVRTHEEIVVDTSAGGRSVFRSAGRTLRRGLETGARAPLAYGFEGTLAWTHLDAVFVDAYTTPGGTVADDNRLPAVARDSLWMELRWRHAPSGFSAALETQGRSRVAVDDRNTDFAPGYAIASAAAGFTQRGAGWRIYEYLRVDNLADRRYVGSVIVNDGNSRFFEPAPGRSASLGVQANLAF